MNWTVEKVIHNLLCVFVAVFPFLVYPWGADYYYANGKAYYFMGAMFLLCLVGWLGSKTSTSIKRKITSTEWFLLFFIILVAVSTVQSVKLSLVGHLTEHQGLFMMISYGALFVIASRWVAHEQQGKIVHFVVVSSFFVALYGILQHAHLGFLPQDRMLTFGTRSYSLFDNPDYFGSYLVLVLILTMTVFLRARDKKWGTVYFLILCTLFLALLQSQTRSGWLGAGMGFVILTLFVVWKRKDLWKKWGIMLLAFILIFTVTDAISKQNYAGRAATIAHDAQKIVSNENSDSAGASRWYIWKASMPLIEEHFWIGTGPNTFQTVFNPVTIKDYKKYLGNSKIYDENNDYIQIALTMGVPALVIYLIFLFTIVRTGFRKAKIMESEQQILTYGLLAAIIGYLVQAFFNISVVSVAPYFWILLGFVSSRFFKKV